MRRHVARLVAAVLLAAPLAPPAAAQEATLKVIATISILADFASNVGGARTEVTSLVGPGGDAHVYAPAPGDVRRVAAARAVIVNGLGLEGWIDRLIEASGTRARIVVASRGVAPRRITGGHRHGEEDIDPHAWHAIANAKVYVANIRDGLIAADPAGRALYEANAAAYLARLDALDAEAKTAVAAIPAGRRRIITSHEAFGYFGAAYGIEIFAAEGVSTDATPTARGVARLITQIRQRGIPAVFLENIGSPQLIHQIARESGARIGGTLYTDALSGPEGPAGSYIDMMRHNIRALRQALAG